MEIHKKIRRKLLMIAEFVLPIGFCGLLWLIVTGSVHDEGSDIRWIKGKVIGVNTHGTDFVVLMKNDKGYNSYYINRYLDDGKSFDSLKQMILHKEIRMKFILNYHLLNPKGRSRPIDTLYVSNSKMY